MHNFTRVSKKIRVGYDDNLDDKSIQEDEIQFGV